MAETIVTDAPERHRFEVHVDGELAGFARYLREDERIVFTHTEIDEAFAGQGLGSVLVRGALQQATADPAVRIVPRCPFVAAWLEKHEDFAERVETVPGR